MVRTMRCLVAVGALALLTLSGCKTDPSTPEHWEKALSGAKSSKQRLHVLEELRESKYADAKFVPMLTGQLASQRQPEVKAEIAKLLGDIKDPSAVQPLTDALDLGNTDSAGNAMNKNIASALAQIGDPKALPTFLKLLKAKDHYTKIEAINGLGALKAKEAVEPLVAVATDENGEPFIAKKAIQALGEIGDEKAVAPLVQMMFKERRGISFYVESSFALYQIGKPAADALLPVLEGKDKNLSAWAEKSGIFEAALVAKAAQVLGDLHDTRAEPALIKALGYKNDMLDIKLFVRMKAADALGRIRSKDAAKPLAAMLDEEEATARQEYIRALIRIGSHEGVPALIKAASSGSWDAREPTMVGVAMLGDEKDLAAFDKFAKDEEKLTLAECKENPDYKGCNAPAELVKKHEASIEGHKKRLLAAKECKADAACWAKKLDDANEGVRERAAYEVGRSGKGELAGELLKRLSEKNLDTRLAIIQATDWLAHDNKQAGDAGFAALGALEKQIADEKGKTEFVKVNEDLRRLAVKLRRHGA